MGEKKSGFVGDECGEKSYKEDVYQFDFIEIKQKEIFLGI